MAGHRFVCRLPLRAEGTTEFAVTFPELIALQHESIWIEVTALLALIAGALMLRGQNWACWFALVWMALHLVISFPVLRQAVIHSVIFALIAWVLSVLTPAIKTAIDLAEFMAASPERRRWVRVLRGPAVGQLRHQEARAPFPQNPPYSGATRFQKRRWPMKAQSPHTPGI
jgi:hypothetical protein